MRRSLSLLAIETNEVNPLRNRKGPCRSLQCFESLYFKTLLQLFSQEGCGCTLGHTFRKGEEMAGCSGCLGEGPVPPQLFITLHHHFPSQGPAKPDGQAQCLPGQPPPSHINRNAWAPNVRSRIPDPLESLEECPWLSQGLVFSLISTL